MNQKELTTRISIPEAKTKISTDASILLSGSCFTEHISEKLDRYKYDVLSNPFGILYNPVSIASSIERIVHLDLYDHHELVFSNGLFHSMDHHSRFSGKDPDQVLQVINSSIQSAHQQLKNCSFAFISPGTSKVYRYSKTKSVVGNCHKIPSTEFRHEQLSPDDCTEAFNRIYTHIKSLSPQCQIVWTVSPVRHLKDGLIENQQSKATLILSLMQHQQKYPDVGYFPAYEIMMDELRDYRYYNRDMVHPSPLAVDIIWQSFEKTYFSNEAITRHAAIEKIKMATAHRILLDDQKAIRGFAQGQVKAIDYLLEQYPDLNMEKERDHFLHLMEKS